MCTLRRRHTIPFLGSMTSGPGLELSGTGRNNLLPYLGFITTLRDTVWGGGGITVRVWVLKGIRRPYGVKVRSTGVGQAIP